MLIWFFYLVGVLLALALQIENSLLSKANSLEGISGAKAWLTHNLVATLLRLFACVIIEPKVIATISQYGVGLTAWGSAGAAGLAASSLIQSVLGFIPQLRRDMPLIAPPSPGPTTETQQPQ